MRVLFPAALAAVSFAAAACVAGISPFPLPDMQRRASWKAMVFLGYFGFMILGHTLAMHAHAGDRTGVARQQRTEARGWLQLERDQTINHEQARVLSPSASRGLEIRERMERNDKRGLDLRQRQNLQGQESKDRLSRSLGEFRPATRASDLRHRRQLDQQRLLMRMNRDIRR